MVGRASPMQGSKTRDGATLALGLLREHHHGLPKACQLARCGRLPKTGPACIEPDAYEKFKP